MRDRQDIFTSEKTLGSFFILPNLAWFQIEAIYKKASIQYRQRLSFICG
jgi:hypothetical protein